MRAGAHSGRVAAGGPVRLTRASSARAPAWRAALHADTVAPALHPSRQPSPVPPRSCQQALPFLAAQPEELTRHEQLAPWRVAPSLPFLSHSLDRRVHGGTSGSAR